ncbi:MAG: fatty acid desaturase [Archangium sp.]|nr:fatty acid desaturase [Archangium sp.]
MRLKHPSDWRQVFIVTVYLSLLTAMVLVPWCRNVGFLVLACMFSFYVQTVTHNVMHAGLFESKALNRVFRLVLSFCGLFPVSSVIPSHNLVHHHFDDDGQPDWASPAHARFSWNLLNLAHFPNIIGPITFAGINRWASVKGRADYRRSSAQESVFAFGLTGLLLAYDFWTVLFFVLVPQLWGARWFLRVNLIQHDACDIASDDNHSRNFGGKLLNWFSVNAGYHTAHHNKPGQHWTELPANHAAVVAPKMKPELMQASLLVYLARTYVFRLSRPVFVEQPAPAALVAKAQEMGEAC